MMEKRRKKKEEIEENYSLKIKKEF